MRGPAVTAVLVLLAACLGACSVLFGLEGYAGSGNPDGGDASPDASFDRSRDSSDAAGDVSIEGASDVVHDTGASDAGKMSDCSDLPTPTAYWKVDEGTGLVVNDSSGHGNTGTLVGSPVWVPGAFDGSAALDFNGTSNQYVDFKDPPDLQLVGSMTISAWFRLSVAGDGSAPDEPILSKRSLGDRGWQLYISDDDIVFDVAHSMSTYSPALYGDGPSLAAGVWYHAVAIYDVEAPSLSLYLNGTLVGAQSADAGAPVAQYNSGNDVHMGASAGCIVDAGCFDDQLFGGLIAEVRLYDVALEVCQVRELP